MAGNPGQVKGREGERERESNYQAIVWYTSYLECPMKRRRGEEGMAKGASFMPTTISGLCRNYTKGGELSLDCSERLKVAFHLFNLSE